MLLISCPYCGPRSLAEFQFERPIETVIPLDASMQETVHRLYTRDNRRDVSLELWRHGYGCRAWLTLERHTVTHEIGRTVLFEAGQ